VAAVGKDGMSFTEAPEGITTLSKKGKPVAKKSAKRNCVKSGGTLGWLYQI